jgi:SAM-dependent methyltransferase
MAPMIFPIDAPIVGTSYGVDDVAYIAQFHAYEAPAWLDHVALLSCIAPPERSGGFSWCDLGCGHGVTAVVLAATHAGGNFFGVDVMPGHIEQARRLASEAGAANAQFLAADFAAADPALGQFDYIVAHGVYSWVSEQTKEDMRRFIDRHLVPGGLVYISYNAMPGWTTERAFQRALYSLGETLPGDSVTRFSAAFAIVRTLADAGAPALASSQRLPDIAKNPAKYPAAYLIHEYMVSAWQPLWVTEVRDAMAGIGLTPVGSATLQDNYDAFVLGQKARETVAAIADDNVRELVRDMFIDTWFRRDVFVRDGRAIDAAERRRALLDTHFALTRPAASVEYRTATTAGHFTFDHTAAHAVVAALAGGPARLANIAAGSTIDAKDILANALVLAAVGAVRPVEPGATPVAALNRAIARRLNGDDAIEIVALPCGTALEVDRALVAALRDGSAPDPATFPGWREFLAAHGL